MKKGGKSKRLDGFLKVEIEVEVLGEEGAVRRAMAPVRSRLRRRQQSCGIMEECSWLSSSPAFERCKPNFAASVTLSRGVTDLIIG